MKAVQFPALLDSISTRKDRSLKIILSTQEMNESDMAELFSYRDKLGYTTFTPAPETHIDVPDAPVDSGKKSQAQRIRNVIYVLWEQSYKAQYPDEDVFYIWYTNRIIDDIKSKLKDE